jgi:hypothetical protein
VFCNLIETSWRSLTFSIARKVCPHVLKCSLQSVAFHLPCLVRRLCLPKHELDYQWFSCRLHQVNGGIWAERADGAIVKSKKMSKFARRKAACNYRRELSGRYSRPFKEDGNPRGRALHTFHLSVQNRGFGSQDGLMSLILFIDRYEIR